MFFLDHIWLIPLFPAFGAACMFFFGRKLSKSAVNGVCVGMVVLAFLCACLAVWQYTGYSAAHPGKPFEKVMFTWLGTGTESLSYPTHGGTAAFHADAGFLLDPLSSIWLLFVTGVGMLIHIYSMGYMAHEGGYYRFFGYLNLFMFSMLTLILANNYALMFVGWEGVGLCSYLLIGFYFQRHSASTAANKAFIVNRVGDAGFLLGMLTIAWYFGSVQYTAINHLARSGQFLHRRSGDHRRLPAAVRRRVRQVGAISALCLAARCDGRSNAGLRTDPRGDHGYRRRLHGGAFQRAVRARAECDEDRRHRRRADRDLRGDYCAGAERHQARAGVLDCLSARLHVSGARRGRICRRRLPRLHPRVLQGAALPRSRLGDSRHGRRAGDAAHGRAEQENQGHFWDHADRDAGHLRHSRFRRLLLEGRDPVGDMVARRRRVSLPVVHRVPHRADDLVLHVPADLPDVLRQAAHEPRSRAPHSRIAQDDDRAAGHPGDLLGRRGIPGIAAQPGRIESLREIPRAGVCQGSRGAASTKVQRRRSPRARSKSSTPIRWNTR